jgi:nitrogen regulatory protein PII
MKSVFIPYNQAYKDRILEILDRMSLRGFTLWDTVQGRGTHIGEPHYGNHAWPTLNSAILTVVPDEKVDALLERLHEMDMKTEQQGLHAYVWNVEKMI